METIIAALVTGIFTGGITLIGILVANSKSQAVMQEQISDLRKDVEKHNNMVERTYAIEQTIAVHEQRITASEARIKKLEGAA
jgi:uncharacterized membrane-anchored protein YhcB (DUF1043 family)